MCSTLQILELVPSTAVSAETSREILVAPELRCSPYEAADYYYSQSLESRIVSSLGDKVYGPYPDRCFSSPWETAIEHIVARSDSQNSRLCASDGNCAGSRQLAREITPAPSFDAQRLGYDNENGRITCAKPRRPNIVPVRRDH